MARQTFSRVINGHIKISPEMAIRLENAGWSSADHWLSVKTAHCLARVRRWEAQIVVEQVISGSTPASPRS